MMIDRRDFEAISIRQDGDVKTFWTINMIVSARSCP